MVWLKESKEKVTLLFLYLVNKFLYVLMTCERFNKFECFVASRQLLLCRLGSNQNFFVEANFDV